MTSAFMQKSFLFKADNYISISIILGIALGTQVGFLLSIFFEMAYVHKQSIRNSIKVIIVLGISFMLMAIKTWDSS